MSLLASLAGDDLLRYGEVPQLDAVLLRGARPELHHAPRELVTSNHPRLDVARDAFSVT